MPLAPPYLNVAEIRFFCAIRESFGGRLSSASMPAYSVSGVLPGPLDHMQHYRGWPSLGARAAETRWVDATRFGYRWPVSNSAWHVPLRRAPTLESCRRGSRRLESM